MTRHEPLLPALLDRFAAARGVPGDKDWAAAAAGRFCPVSTPRRERSLR